VFWYPFLTRISPGRGILDVIKRVAVDQSIGTPIVIGLVFIFNAFLQGKGISDAISRIGN